MPRRPKRQPPENREPSATALVPNDDDWQALAEVILSELARRIPGTPTLTWELAAATGEFAQLGFAGPYPILKSILTELIRSGMIDELPDGQGWAATTLGRHAAQELIEPQWPKPAVLKPSKPKEPSKCPPKPESPHPNQPYPFP